MRRTLLALSACVVSLVAAQDLRIVGYYPSWGRWNRPAYTPGNIDFRRLTHVAWSFVWPDSLGNLVGLEEGDGPVLDTLVARAHASGVKVVVSLGGAGQCDGFGPATGAPDRRARFCGQVGSFVRDHALDGVDIDWEYADEPSRQDTAGYSALVRELRDSLGRNPSLSAALPASAWGGKWFSVEGFADSLDWLGIMTYDMTGSWDTQTGFNSPLYDDSRPGFDHPVAEVSVSSSMAYWNRTRGVPKSKLLYGQPFFGFVFPGATAPGAAFTGDAEYVDYRDVVERLPTWSLRRDDTAQADWASTPEGGYATWDQPATVAVKARWARSNGYAGAIVWDLSQDALPNAGHPLLDSLALTLRPDGTATRPRSGALAANLSREGRFLVARWPAAEPARLELVGLDGRRLGEVRGLGGELRVDLAGIARGTAAARLTWPGGDRRILVGTR